MSREYVVRAGVLVWLALVWIALWGHITVANILGGLAVGAVVMLVMPLPGVPVQGWVRPLALLKLIGVSLYYAAESSLQVSWFSVRPGPPPIAGVLRVYFSFKSDLVLVLCVNLLNLIPGTVVLEIDRERCVVYVHVIDVGSEEAVDKFYRTSRQLERLLIETFQRPVTEKPSEVKS